MVKHIVLAKLKDEVPDRKLVVMNKFKGGDESSSCCNSCYS